MLEKQDIQTIAEIFHSSMNWCGIKKVDSLFSRIS